MTILVPVSVAPLIDGTNGDALLPRAHGTTSDNFVRHRQLCLSVTIMSVTIMSVTIVSVAISTIKAFESINQSNQFNSSLQLSGIMSNVEVVDLYGIDRYYLHGCANCFFFIFDCH